MASDLLMHFRLDSPCFAAVSSKTQTHTALITRLLAAAGLIPVTLPVIRNPGPAGRATSPLNPFKQEAAQAMFL